MLFLAACSLRPSMEESLEGGWGYGEGGRGAYADAMFVVPQVAGCYRGVVAGGFGQDEIREPFV
jgi:hypothetical protein